MSDDERFAQGLQDLKGENARLTRKLIKLQAELADVRADRDSESRWADHYFQEAAQCREQLRDRRRNAQTEYNQAWSAYTALLKRMGAAVGVPLPGDVRYADYAEQVFAKVKQLTAALTELVDLRSWQLDRAGRVVAVAEAVARARDALAVKIDG